MLNSLAIENGELLPNFDKYNLNYTVNIESDVNQLMIYAEAEDNSSTIVVNGNKNLVEHKNLVTIDVIKDNVTTTYSLMVYKKEEEQVASVVTNENVALASKSFDISKYAAPLVGGSCFFIILVIFVLLFHKRKSK